MRQVILDTETTGLEPSQGHKIIEIGCVEMLDRKLTGRTYHQYIQPDREIDDGAIEVHGITNEFLQDKPRFSEVYEEFLAFVDGAELVIHNASFDVGFIDSELAQISSSAGKTSDYCSVLDTLAVARKKHPGQRNSLDALCKRYYVDNSKRDLHGALLDAEILADVYLAMTGGQTSLLLGIDGVEGQNNKEELISKISKDRSPIKVIYASDDELALHEARLDKIRKSGDGKCAWDNNQN